jgi:hypothetical protein
MAFTIFLRCVRNLERIATLRWRDFSEVRALFLAEAILAKIFPLCSIL